MYVSRYATTNSIFLLPFAAPICKLRQSLCIPLSRLDYMILQELRDDTLVRNEQNVKKSSLEPRGDLTGGICVKSTNWAPIWCSYFCVCINLIVLVFCQNFMTRTLAIRSPLALNLKARLFRDPLEWILWQPRSHVELIRSTWKWFARSSVYFRILKIDLEYLRNETFIHVYASSIMTAVTNNFNANFVSLLKLWLRSYHRRLSSFCWIWLQYLRGVLSKMSELFEIILFYEKIETQIRGTHLNFLFSISKNKIPSPRSLHTITNWIVLLGWSETNILYFPETWVSKSPFARLAARLRKHTHSRIFSIHQIVPHSTPVEHVLRRFSSSRLIYYRSKYKHFRRYKFRLCVNMMAWVEWNKRIFFPAPRWKLLISCDSIYGWRPSINDVIL